MQGTAPPPEEESQELARFRREWLAELQRRKPDSNALGKLPEDTSEPKQAASSNTAANLLVLPAVYSPPVPGPSSQTISGTPSAFANYTPSAHFADAGQLPFAHSKALDVYRRAVKHEQKGELDDALALYRQSFRMYANVDRAYHREEMLASIDTAQKELLLSKAAPSSRDPSVDELAAKVQHSLAVTSRTGMPGVSVTRVELASLLEKFPEDLSFEPESETEPVHLQKVPDEVLVMIIRKLDKTSIERFACVNRKARVVTLDSAIWRDLVTGTYIPPQVADVDDMTPVLERCRYDFRRVYIEHPRVRLDGVYIATCHYVWVIVNLNLTITVILTLLSCTAVLASARTLGSMRFLPNGQVLSLLANEENTPQQVIPLLKSTLRMKGLYIGTWHLSGTTIQLSNLMDASGRFPLPGDNHSHGATESAEGNRYNFVMTLSLVSRPLGRWNKMHIEAYNSVKLDTGDMHPVALKHERPFWFSKVRSWHVL
ncbi:hypothetical protein DXG03_001560 [Asterophora parasitica]|uniref:F-box only protein 9 n=1 Tax=Asterophora parasitica TaxID=117018 RepID=A0A9P7KCR0_9AGAR|nr:hypothetical protein DXG03_001560 [Asterophora parasitica]